MKKILFALSVSFAAQAFAAVGWVQPNPPSVRWFGKPDYVDLDGIRHWSPTDAQCIEAGWVACEYGGEPRDAVLDYSAVPPLRDMTQDELDARAQAEADAQSEAAAMAGPDPELFVPALDENGNKVGTARIVVRAATWEVVPLTNEASPKRIWVVQRDEFKSRIARADAVKNKIKSEKAKGNGNAAVLGRISALEASQGVE